MKFGTFDISNMPFLISMSKLLISIVTHITVSTNEIYQLVFLKKVVLKHSTLGATAPFVEHLIHTFLLAKSNQK